MSQLNRTFGLWAGVSMVVGSIIGSGIFMKPATMAGQLGSPEALIAVWIIAGIIVLFGALTNAEIAAMIPETGGQYVFFQKMYGDFFAFLYGWSAFAVFNTAAVASIAYVFATYAGNFFDLPVLDPELVSRIDLYVPFIGHIFPLQDIGLKGVTITLIVLLTYINYRSVAIGGRVLVIFTALKVAAIAFLVLTILFSGMGSMGNFTQDALTSVSRYDTVLGAWIAAMAGAFWAYDGWNNITFVSGEIKDPQRNISRSLLLGLPLCILVYVLVNFAFLYVMPVEEMQGQAVVASAASSVVFGAVGAGLVALMIMLSTFGATQSNILSVTRVTFAMSRSGLFFKSVGKVHPRFDTPGNALWAHGLLACLWAISGSFDMLTDMLIFVSFLFYGMGAWGVFVLRKKMPDAPRPYKVWGYPWIPAIFVVFALVYLGMTLYNDVSNYLNGNQPIIQSLLGAVIVALGIPVYIYFNRKRHQPESTRPEG